MRIVGLSRLGPCKACRRYASQAASNAEIEYSDLSGDAISEEKSQTRQEKRHREVNLGSEPDKVRKEGQPRTILKKRPWETALNTSPGRVKLRDKWLGQATASDSVRISRIPLQEAEKDYDLRDLLLSDGERKHLVQHTASLITGASGLRALQPGDLVETRECVDEPKLKIHMRKGDVERGGSRDMFLDDCGLISYESPNAALFTVPQFVPSYIVEKALSGIGTGQLPPWSRTHPLVAKLREFNYSVDKKYMGLGLQTKVLSLYEDCIKKGRDSINVFDASQMFFGSDNVSNDQYLATHMALMQDFEHFVADPRRHRNTLTFRVLEPRLVHLTRDVSSWIQNDTEEVQSFIRMVQAKIIFYRKKVEAHDGEGKLDHFVHGANFSEPHLRIIEFVKAYIFERRRLQMSRLPAHACKLLKSIELYQNMEITQDTALKLLIEIGVYRPWENLLLYDRQLALPHYGSSSEADSAAAKMEEKYSLDKSYDSLRLDDAMLSKRKDWGDIPVYCIDSASTTEVDDGISIEKVSPEVDWLHVHVANPSAFIPPQHELAMFARQRLETIYLPERNFFMLPPLLSQQKFSLRPQESCPVITFSVKVGAQGEILDYKVQHGFVSNVKRVTYDEADRVFGYHAGSKSVRFTTGPMDVAPNSDGITVDLPRPNRLDLDQIRLIANRLVQNRLKGGAFNISRPGCEVRIQPNPMPLPHASFQCNYENLLPTLTLKVTPGLQLDSFMWHVAETMIAAGNVAAKFCDEHGIPAIFRATEVNDAYGRFSELIGRRGADGLLSFTDGVQISKLVMTKATSEPGRHDAIGLNEYARATSPLRRYADLLLHWQIDAFMRKDKFPFEKLAIERDMHDFSRRERLIRTIARNSDKFWVLQGMKRLHDNNQLPKLTARVTEYATDRDSRLLTSFGVNAHADLRGEVHMIGQEIEIMPMRFDFVDRTLLVKKV